MEKLLLNLDEKIIEIKELVHKVKEYLADSPVPKAIRDGLEKFDRSTARYIQAIDSDDIDNIAQAAKAVAVYGQLLGQSIPSFKEADEKLKIIGGKLNQHADEFRSMVENSPLEYKPINKSEEDKNSVDLHNFKSVKKSLKMLADEHEMHNQRIKKLLNENEVRIENVSVLSKNLEVDVKKEIKKVVELYEGSLAELESKKAQVDEILGHVSGRAIAGDFEKSAGEEKIMANRLRYASLACMALIVSVVAYSFWETTSEDFNWQNSIFRIILAFLLSIPAAYLARESAKHREQQYVHLQTSLDLKTIAPYIASLPEDEQHKIKVEIAGRLFLTKDFSKVSANPYPVNTHEIMMEIIKKLDFKKNESKA